MTSVSPAGSAQAVVDISSESGFVNEQDINGQESPDSNHGPQRGRKALSIRNASNVTHPSEDDLDVLQVMVSPVSRPWEYQKFEEDTTVDRVLEEITRSGVELCYKIAFQDGKRNIVSRIALSLSCFLLLRRISLVGETKSFIRCCGAHNLSRGENNYLNIHGSGDQDLL